ncbi:hypothetical protein D9M73_116540 [compost metagenome]
MKTAVMPPTARPGTPQAHGVAFSEVQKAQADLAYNADKAYRAHRENEARALRLQIQDQRPALASGVWA